MSRREKILLAATEIAEESSLQAVTSYQVSKRIDIVRSSVLYYFKTHENLRDEVVKKAIADSNIRILGQALYCGNKMVKNISPALRNKVLNALR